MIKRRRPLPDWANELMKELMRPPYFLEHILPGNGNGDAGTPAAGDEPSGENAAGNQSVENRHRERRSVHDRSRMTGDRAWSSGHRDGGPHRRSDNPGSSPSSGNGRGSNTDNRTTDKRNSNHPSSYSRSTRVPSSSKPQSHNDGSTSTSNDIRPRRTDEGDIVQAAATPTHLGPSSNWQFVFKRNGFPISLVKAYGWTVKRAESKYGVIRVQTNKGSYAVKRGHLKPEKLSFLHDAFRYLEQQGFTHLAPIALASSGKPYVVRKEQAYYATKWIAGQPVNFSSVGQVRQVARVLAEFHELSRGFESEQYTPPMEFHIDDLLRERTEDLKGLLARAQTRTDPDAFDRSLANRASTLREDAEASVRIIESTDCLSFLRDDEETPALCHLDVIPGNFMYTPEQKVIAIDFDMCTYGPRALDLAHLLRRALQQQRWLPDVAYTCFLEYNNVHSISAPEYRVVEALLRFPYRAWRVAHSRYRLGPQDGQSEEIELAVRELPRRNAFLESFHRQIRS